MLIFLIKYAKLVDGKGKGSIVFFFFLNVRRQKMKGNVSISQSKLGEYESCTPSCLAARLNCMHFEGHERGLVPVCVVCQ